MRQASLILLCTLCTYCAGDPNPSHGTLSKVPEKWSESESNPQWQFDPTASFALDFGRGSGWHGLETIALKDGKVTLHRTAEGVDWESASFSLSPDEVGAITRATDDLGVASLGKSYQAAVHDGTQWVLWIRQGENEKSIYFNNHFPAFIQKFSRKIDQVLKVHHRKLTWNRVPQGKSGQHDSLLWKSIH